MLFRSPCVQHPAAGNREWINKASYYLLALLFFFLSCLSKGMAVSLSLTLIFIDYLLVRKFNAKAVMDKIPFFALSLIFGLIVTLAYNVNVQTANIELPSFTEKIRFAGFGLLFYVYKLILPYNLSAFYPYPAYQFVDLQFYYWIFPLLVIVVTGMVVYSRKFTRKIIFGFGFFVATIVLVLQLFPTNRAIVADHYTYIPYIGFFYLAGEGFSYLTSSGRSSFFHYRKPIIVIGITVFLIFSFLTNNRIKVWQNSLSLWNDAMEKYPNEFIILHIDRKSTRLNSSHIPLSRMPSSA